MKFTDIKTGRPSYTSERLSGIDWRPKKMVGDLQEKVGARKTKCPPAENLEKMIFHHKNQIPASQRP